MYLSKDHEYIKSSRFTPKDPETCHARLQQIMYLTDLGWAARDIAVKLRITDRTVTRYRNHPPERARVGS